MILPQYEGDIRQACQTLLTIVVMELLFHLKDVIDWCTVHDNNYMYAQGLVFVW